MTQDVFIHKFNHFVQNDIDNIKKIARNTENKLFILSSILFAIVIGSLFLVNHFDLHIIFFVIILFTAVMIYYVGTYAFRYEYQDLLQKNIFPKIVKMIMNNGKLQTNSHLLYDANMSDMFSLYDYKLATVDINSKWSIEAILEKHKISISSTYLSWSDIENPALPFTDMKNGLFIVIEDLNIGDSEIYIFEKSLFLLLKEIVHKRTKGFNSSNTIDGRYIVISKSLDNDSMHKISSLLKLFDKDTTISCKKNKMYIFIEKEFACFDQEYYQNGKVPSYYDYIEFINIKNSIEKVIRIYEE